MEERAVQRLGRSARFPGQGASACSKSEKPGGPASRDRPTQNVNAAKLPTEIHFCSS
jgi:hypothetical protein